MEPVHLTLFLLAISVQGIMAIYPCNLTTITGNGTVFPGEIPPTMKNCTFTFSINATADTLMLVFSSLGSLGSGDNIVIIAGSEVNTSIISRNDPVTVVSTSNKTVVTFLRGSGNPGTFRLDFNNVCEQEVNPSSGYLASPKYLIVTKKIIECNYNVMNPEGQITLLEFADFTLNSSNLTVNGTKVTAGSKKLPNDMLLPTNTIIVLRIPNPEKAVEGFSSILTPVMYGCSDPTFNVSKTFSYTSTSAGVCHLMINGSSDTLVATVKSWQTDFSDQLQFRDGFSLADNLLISGSPVQPDIALASSGPEMSVHLVFVRTIKERNVTISFTSQVFGGLVKVGESIMYESDKSGGEDGVFQCTMDAGKKVSLTNFNMTNNGKVEVYDGNRIVGVPLFTIMNTSLPIPVFVKTNQMTVVTKKGSSNYNFTATTGEARDCDQFLQPGLGSYAVNASGPNDTYTCNLIILPTPNGDNRGTLQLTSLALCPGDKVTIFEGITTIAAQKELVEFTNNSTYQFFPQYIFAADKGARIETALSKCESRKAGDVVVTASYDVKTLDSLCGKSPSSPIGSVKSPYYPLRYPLNLNCQWTFENKTDSFLYITVDKLNITDGSSLKLTGNITEFSFPTDKTLGRDLIFNKNKDLMLSFTSESKTLTLVLPGEGFVINYNYLDCGGSINANFNTSLGGSKKDCRWIVSLPSTTQDSVLSEKLVYIIDAKLEVSADYVAGSLIVYDSTNMTDTHRVNLTNLTSTNMLTFKSRVDTFIIQYLNNNITAKMFTLAVNINRYLCTNFCQNGICMHNEWLCNGINECGDNTDELACPPPVPPPKPTPQPNKGDVPGFWLAIMLIIGLIIGILLPFIIPAIYRRMKKRTYNRMTDMDNITADDYTPMD